MKFRTEFIAEKAPFTLSPARPVILVGSCFSQNIARKMEQHQWEAHLPTGTLYNPLSIALALRLLIDSEKGASGFEDSLFQHNGIWNSFLFPSSFSSAVRERCIEEFRKRQEEFQDAMKKGAALIITLGTSICYRLKETGEVVGNCHKLPSERFYKERLSVSEIRNCMNPVIQDLKKDFSGIRIIFTVSPVRHLKDGFVGNARSKAILQLGVEEICSQIEGCYYFPAYEILNDDLRDYRFYASDLCHPSEDAVEYVWEKFCDTYLDNAGLNLIKEGNRKYKTSLHRPIVKN